MAEPVFEKLKEIISEMNAIAEEMEALRVARSKDTE